MLATLLGSVVVPAVPFVLGVLLVVAAVLLAVSPALRSRGRALLGTADARNDEWRLRLLLTASAGVLLVASGVVGASTRGTLRSKWSQRVGRREIAESRVDELLAAARGHLAAGDIDRAEFALTDATALSGAAGRSGAVDDLLQRVQRSGDAAAILDVLSRLPQREFDAFARGAAVPDAFDFGERSLNARAIQLALDQLEAARRLRARR